MRALNAFNDYEYAAILTDLGLSELQSKIYLSLTKLGRADIGLISKNADVARQNTYRVMPSLERLGLTEKILSHPILYNAMPLEDVVSKLMEKRSQKTEEIRRKVAEMSVARTALIYDTPVLEEPKFSVQLERAAIIKNTNKLIDNSEKFIDIIIENLGLHYLETHFEEFRLALKRGVKIRLIMSEKLKKNAEEIVAAYSRCQFFEVSYLSSIYPSTKKFGLTIFDKKKLSLCTASEAECVGNLLSNSDQLLWICNGFFEYLWNNKRVPNGFTNETSQSILTIKAPIQQKIDRTTEKAKF